MPNRSLETVVTTMLQVRVIGGDLDLEDRDEFVIAMSSVLLLNPAIRLRV